MGKSSYERNKMNDQISLPKDPLISAKTLKNWISKGLNPVILDASWHLPDLCRSGRGEFENAHIRGALFFDINALGSKTSPLPHRMPSPDYLAEKLGDMGISHNDIIVVLDNSRLKSSCRAWWMIKSLGHEKIFLVDGGMTDWRRSAYPVTVGENSPREKATYSPSAPEHPFFIKRDDIDTLSCAILDARSPERFEGKIKNPKSSTRSGHIPGSRNRHYEDFFDKDGKFKPKDDLKSVLGLRGKRPVVTTCNSGVTAAILAFTLYRLGRRDVSLYDGSWEEWGSTDPIIAGDEPKPVETGAVKERRGD